MFQAAFAKALAMKHGKDVVFFDLTGATRTRREWGLDCFGIISHPASRFLKWPILLFEISARKLLPSSIRKKSGLVFEGAEALELQQIKSPVLVSGYWQGYRYIKEHESHVRRMFVFPSMNGDENQWLNSDKRQIVGMHVRCGDYIRNPKTAAYHHVCTPEWYARAWNGMRERHKDVRLIVISDEPEWAMRNLRLPGRVDFVPKDVRRPTWADMCLLSQCNHFILSNSSFSWWAAFLGAPEGSSVFVPSDWYPGVSTRCADMLLPQWNVVNVEAN